VIAYQARASALAGIPAGTDPARLDLLARHERERGMRIPASAILSDLGVVDDPAVLEGAVSGA
jgi:hypothetical protein